MQVNLFEALLAQRSFPRVLVVSSGGVYAQSSGVLTERSATGASSPYVVSKLAQELVAAHYAQRGFEVIVARPFNHVGPGQQRGYLVADLASQTAAGERTGGAEIRVGNLASERDYTDVRDVVTAYCALLERGRAGETYNVCSGRSYSGSEVFARLSAHASVSVSALHEEARDRPLDVMHVHASNEKICLDTGWRPTISLDQTLADTLAYWREAS